MKTTSEDEGSYSTNFLSIDSSSETIEDSIIISGT